MKAKKLTGIIIAHNEERNIERAIKSLNFCDEVIVVDDYSADKTQQKSKKLGVTLYKHHLNNDFASQRNWAMSKAHGEWILFIDADEYVSNKLKEEIIRAISGPFNGFYFHRVDVLWNKVIRHGEIGSFGSFGNAKILRLARSGSGKWSRAIHETWGIKGNVGSLENKLLHYPHQTLSEFIFDIGKRAKIHAGELKKEKKSPTFIKVILWPVGKVFVNHVIKLGFLDGTEGFVVNILMSFHSFISWSELWLKKQS